MVEIRPLREPDLAAYYRWQDEEPHWELYTCRPVEHIRPYATFAMRYLEAFESRQQIIYTILSDGRAVGRFVASDHNPRNRSMEIGYYIQERSRGQGVGGHALPLFTAALFRWPRRNLYKLYATTADDNIASQAILRKAGFSLDGRLREHYLVGDAFRDQLFYSILRREWEGLPGKEQ